jgi:hypothetical protein
LFQPVGQHTGSFQFIQNDEMVLSILRGSGEDVYKDTEAAERIISNDLIFDV